MTQINKSVSLRRKGIKTFFEVATKKGLASNKSFWKFVRLFLTDKNFHTQNGVMLKIIIEEEHDLVGIFNDHYINLAKKSSGEKPRNYLCDANLLDDDMVTDKIVHHYKVTPA